MRKSFLIFIAVLAVSGAVIWHWQSVQNNPPAVAPSVSPDLPPLSESNSGSDDTADVGADNFQALALKIIERPIAITAKLNDATKKLAEEKIKEAIGLIRNNYDFLAAWYDLGAYRRLIGDYEGAIEAYNFISLIRPQEYISYSNLGDLYAYDLKDYEKGEQNFLKVISRDPANINAYLQLALIYEYGQRKFQEAENILLLGIKANPSVPNLKTALAEHYERNGRKGDALRYFEEALSLDPANQYLRQLIDQLKSS